jgi:MFS family permease
MRLGMGPFFLPIAQDLGFSRTLLATIMAAGMLCYGLAMPVAGLLVTRHGTRNVLLAGAAIVLVSALWAANTRSATGFLFAFGVCFSVGLAFTSPVALTPVISHWFTRRRGMALFFLATGSMAGIAIMTPLMALAIDGLGWRATLLGCAAVLAACTVPAALFVIREMPTMSTAMLPREAAAQEEYASSLDQPLEPAQAIRTGPFWLIVFGLFCCGFSMNLLGTHGVPMLVDHGFSVLNASGAIGLVGTSAIVGSMLLGAVADRLPQRTLLAAVYLVRGLGFLGLVMAATGGTLYFIAGVTGLVWAGGAALSSTILADVYGVRRVGFLYGLAYFGHQVGAALSSFLGGWAYERFGTHWVSFGACAALLATAALVALQLPRRPMLALAPRPAPAP